MRHLFSASLMGSLGLTLALMACGSGDGPSGNGINPDHAKRIFISSTKPTGSFGSLAAGDFICQTDASTAGVGGSWKAWLSDSTGDAISRINDVGPWYSIDRADLIFLNKAAMVSSNPANPITKTATGATSSLMTYWTGTSAAGVSGGLDACTHWSLSAHGFLGVYGQGDLLTGSSWTNQGTEHCDAHLPLLCIEQ